MQNKFSGNKLVTKADQKKWSSKTEQLNGAAKMSNQN